MKKQKQILAKLMALDNEQVDKKLSEFADGILKRIMQSDTNEERLEELELLKEFVYKVPGQTIAVTHYILAHPLEEKQTKVGEILLPGRDHDKVVLETLELLNEIRYIDADSVLPIVAEIIQGENLTYKQKALEILKRFARYDLNVLKKSQIGYGAQRKALDFVLGWPREERIHRLDFIEIVASSVLGSSVEGTTASAEDTLTFHFSVVQPTEFLKKMRREAMDLLFDIYSDAGDDSQRLRILKILEEVTRGPSSVAYGDDVLNMMVDDSHYLLDFFRQILFGHNGKFIASLAIAEEIETRLYWWTQWGAFNTPAAAKLRAEILALKSYRMFRLLVGDGTIVYRGERERDEALRSREIEKLFEAITEKSVGVWIRNLNLMADQLGPIQEWQFLNFKIFLRRLAKEKPDIAKKILDDAYERKTNLAKFSSVFFDGFRDVNRLDLWDQAVKRIVTTQDVLKVSAIIFSLNYDTSVDLETVIRDEDLKILTEITSEEDRFSFLRDSEEKNFQLHYALINTLLRNFKRQPKLLERLILEELLEHPEYNNVFVQAFMLSGLRHWVEFDKFSAEGVDQFKSWLIELPDLDWHMQDVLVDFGKNDLQIILDVFWGRIEHEVKQKETSKLLIDRVRYDAIPYHINESLQKRIGGDPRYLELISKWLAHTTPDWSLYDWNIGEFISRIGSSFRIILMSLIEKGDDENLARAAHLLDRVHGNKDIDLCMEIVKRTDNEDVLSTVEAVLSSSGVVSGIYGIAEAYESKARLLEPYTQNEDKHISKFASKLKEGFLKSAEAERKRADEWKRLRKTEFEG